MIKAVIFDLDNTLYDYDRCNAIAEYHLYRMISANLNLTYEAAEETVRKAKIKVKENLGTEVAASHNRLLYMQNVCEQLGKDPLKYALEFYNVYWDTMLREMELFDYVNPLIGSLRNRGIQTGILTDLTAHIQYRKIISLGLSGKIDCLVTSEEAGEEKPSRKIFKRMLEKLSVLPEEALMIGDSQRKDVDGAISVGMQAVRYVKGMDVYERTATLLG